MDSHAEKGFTDNINSSVESPHTEHTTIQSSTDPSPPTGALDQEQSIFSDLHDDEDSIIGDQTNESSIDTRLVRAELKSTLIHHVPPGAFLFTLRNEESQVLGDLKQQSGVPQKIAHERLRRRPDSPLQRVCTPDELIASFMTIEEEFASQLMARDVSFQTLNPRVRIEQDNTNPGIGSSPLSSEDPFAGFSSPGGSDDPFAALGSPLLSDSIVPSPPIRSDLFIGFDGVTQAGILYNSWTADSDSEGIAPLANTSSQSMNQQNQLTEPSSIMKTPRAVRKHKPVPEGYFCPSIPSSHKSRTARLEKMALAAGADDRPILERSYVDGWNDPMYSGDFLSIATENNTSVCQNRQEDAPSTGTPLLHEESGQALEITSLKQEIHSLRSQLSQYKAIEEKALEQHSDEHFIYETSRTVSDSRVISHLRADVEQIMFLKTTVRGNLKLAQKDSKKIAELKVANQLLEIENQDLRNRKLLETVKVKRLATDLEQSETDLEQSETELVRTQESVLHVTKDCKMLYDLCRQLFNVHITPKMAAAANLHRRCVLLKARIQQAGLDLVEIRHKIGNRELEVIQHRLERLDWEKKEREVKMRWDRGEFQGIQPRNRHIVRCSAIDLQQIDIEKLRAWRTRGTGCRA